MGDDIVQTRAAGPSATARPADVVIAGAGIAGLSLAVALKQALGGGFRIIICDPAFVDDPVDDGRASAIAAASRRLFESLGIWHRIAPLAQPINRMIVSDSRLEDPVRPGLLHFDGTLDDGEPFAHMIENTAIIRALVAAARELDIPVLRTSVSRLRTDECDAITAVTAAGTTLRTPLLVGADGAKSRVRQLAGIGWLGWPYGQSGIVATIAHERDHEGIARQHFLPPGPFAILPLTGRRSSLVWNERTEDARALLSLDESDLLDELERRFGLELGELRFETKPRAFPLGLGVARRFTAPNLALIGDAAHLCHPIAGQGLNLGLRDVARFAELVTETVRLGLTAGDPGTLAAYEKARRFDTFTMGAVTDGLNRLFSNDVLPLRLARDLGIGLVDRLPPLKRFLIREAAGIIGDVPPLMRPDRLSP